MSTYKYTEDGQKVLVVSEIRADVWEVQYVFTAEYFDPEEDDFEYFESEKPILHHGKLYDTPPIPVQHARVKELEAEIKRLEEQEVQLNAKVEALQRAEREFENPTSLIYGLGNLKRLLSERPTHFYVHGTEHSLPSIKKFSEASIIQDGVATLRIIPSRDYRSKDMIYWNVRFGWSGDGVQATPCFSEEEAIQYLKKRLEYKAKQDDLGYDYTEWKTLMQQHGIQPSQAATDKFNEKQNKAKEKKKIELQESIKRQQAELEKLQGKP